MTKATEARWMNVKEGDVFRAPSGMMRVVRKVSRADNRRSNPMRKVHVTFTIQHCSWTRRFYTIYNLGELRDLGYRLTSANWPLRTEFDRLAADELEACKNNSHYRSVISCCAVKGIT